ncbi:hypothetical protein KJ815_12295 [bacterium]|nr:hypothetical protein [bacterium]
MSCAFAQEVTIYDIQFTTDSGGNSPLVGQTVATGGVVTAVGYTAQPIRYFISDPQGGLWHGILVNDNQNRNLSIGDSVRFQAEVQESNGQTRLRNIVSGSFVVGQPGSLVAPAMVGSGEIGESAEGVLVELTNAVVVAVQGTEFTVDDGSGPVVVGRGWTFAHSPLVGDTLRYLRGLVTSVGTVYTLNPRDDNDFGFFSNRAPLFSAIANRPTTPSEFQSDTVTAIITDDGAVASASLFYRFGNTGEFIERPMYDDGLHGDGAAGDSRWGGIIPAGPARSTCYYYLWAQDDEGAAGTSPANAPATTYSYVVRSSILTIYDLQFTGNPTGGSSRYADSVVTVIGIVTGAGFGNNGDDFYMSDPIGIAPEGGRWSGIFVYGGSIAPALGDCVRVAGQVIEYNGLTEFTGGAVVTVLGQGAAFDTLLVRVGELPDSSEAYEGCLIQVGRCWVSNTSDWPTQYPAFRITDATGTAYVVKDAPFEYVPFIGDTFTSITGCVSYYSGHGWELAPRFDADIGIVDRRPPSLVSATAISDTTVNVLFNERLSSAYIADIANYRIVDQTDTALTELHVDSAYLFSTNKTIQLITLERLLPSHAYQLTVTRVEDVSGNALTGAVIGFSGYEPGEYVQIADIYRDFQSYERLPVTLRGVVNFVQDVTTTSGSRRI